MAHMNQEKKKALEPAIKEICKRHGVKASLSVQDYSTLVLTIKSSHIDFLKSYNEINLENNLRYAQETPDVYEAKTYVDVNNYYYEEHFSGEALAFLKEVFVAMNVGNHNRSDSQSDYFDIGWYVDVTVGSWDKPYKLTTLEAQAA